jgi:biotin-dependent carboxylase-like uncharacterized protein
MIEILSETALATVQDLGRVGALGFGVGTAGAMDDMAVAAGNLLLGNPETAAAIELQIFPFALRFHEACAFTVTGADCAATLDGKPILPWWACTAEAGQELRLGVPGAAAWRGSRAYLCVAGGIDVPAVLGSRSTQLRGAFGGHHGRALRQHDALAVGAPGAGRRKIGFGVLAPSLVDPLQADGVAAVRVLPAAEYALYTTDSLAAFWEQPWKITPQSDRYGYRLAGPTLTTATPVELRSHGIVPGVIQVPPGGQPIVQMRDAQPTGGYPKIGTVISADLWRLGQAPIGSQVRFVRCDWAEAVAAASRNRDYLDGVRRLAGLYRGQTAKA